MRLARNELDDFANDLLSLAKTVSSKKEARELLKNEGNKLKKETIKEAKRKVNKKTGNLHSKGIKRGKPYTYKVTDEETVRVYGRYHTHLLNDGHRIVDKYGNEHGFKEGEHFFESAETNFTPKFIKNVEVFVDKIIKDNKL